MFSSVPVAHSIDFEGQKMELQTGLLAKQATSVLAKIGETTVLAAVVVGKEKNGDYFPLQIVYEERLYAAGKIKGSRFVKREGKPTDNAVLTGRMVDRSLRSLFSAYLRTEIQVVITVLSLDNVNPPDTLAVMAASSALTLCGLCPREVLQVFDFCDTTQKTWPKNPEIRPRAVAIIQVKGTQNFVSFVKKNQNEIYNDGYFLPGGGLEMEENSVEAAARETLEELGIGGLRHLKSLGKCQVSLPYDGNISQGIEFYEWFEVDKFELGNLAKSEKDEQNWQIEIVDIDKLQSNNWPQLNIILEKLEDELLVKELNLVNLADQEIQNSDFENQKFTKNETSDLTSFDQNNQLSITKNSPNSFSTADENPQKSLEHFVTRLENTAIFTGPVSSVRLGLEIQPLGLFWKNQIEEILSNISHEEVENWEVENLSVQLEVKNENLLENQSEKLNNPSNPDNYSKGDQINSQNSNFQQKNEEKTRSQNSSKLTKIMSEIAQTLDKNNSEDLDFIRQIGNILGRKKMELAIHFKEIYKKTTRLSKTEIWLKYPTKFEFITNPSYEAQSFSKMDLVVSGNGQNIVMVECGAQIVPENIIAEGFDVACAKLQILTDFQVEFIKKCQKVENTLVN